MEITDEKLVEQYLKKGDEAALETLINRYLPLVHGISRHYTGDADKASDITQEAFVKAWRNLKGFDRSKKFRKWLFSIAKNTALDWLRKKEPTPFSKIKISEDISFEETIADPRTLPEMIVESRFAARDLAEAVEKLPANYKTIVSMRNDEGLKFNEIARLLKESINTVKSRYRRALKLLRGHLEERGL